MVLGYFRAWPRIARVRRWEAGFRDRRRRIRWALWDALGPPSTAENHDLYGLLLRENPSPAEPPLPVLSEKLTVMACAQADAHPFMC
jgi:hypothetical protein